MRKVGVFCSASDDVDPIYLKLAKDVGSLLSKHNIQIIYGGGTTGMMGALGSSSGNIAGIVCNDLVEIEGVMDHLSEIHTVKTITQRKQKFEELCDAFLILPGGYGTLDEFFEIIVLKKMKFHNKPIIIYNFNGFWDPLLALLKHFEQTNFGKMVDIQVCNTLKELEIYLN